MAYLFKHTPLQTNFPVNLTCLVPTEESRGRPSRAPGSPPDPLHFLHFRLDVVTRRLEHELEALRKRIHILEGFEKVFDALDEILKIVRKSEGKADAAQQIIKRFALDAEQTDAILELKIYRLARLEILVIRKELDEKRKRARQIGGAPEERGERAGRSSARRSRRSRRSTATPRRTKISSDEGEAEYTAEDFIVEEDNVVIVSRDGWVKRQKEVKDIVDDAAAGGRRGAGGAARAARARRPCSSATSASPTRARIADVPASTGYGEPIQRLLQVEGRRTDRRGAQPGPARARGSSRRRRETPAKVHAVAVTSDGYSLRFSLEPFVEPSTRAGRRFARTAEGAEFVGVARLTGGEILIAATREARAMLTKADEINFLSGPGRGVILIKLDKEDRVLGFIASTGDRDLMTVETTARRGADDQHHEVRSHRPRRQRPRAAAARAVHEGRARRPGGAGAAVLRGDARARLARGKRLQRPACLRVRDGFCRSATRTAGRA